MAKLGGGVEGFNVDLANQIARRLKRPINIEATQFSGLIPGLNAKKYDWIAAPTTVTPERAKALLFTEGYLDTDFQFLDKKPRAFPPLVLLIFIYFGFPFLSIEMPKLAALALGFFLNTSSYFGEIFRAGIESIARGQMEAALSMGLKKRQAYRYIILPQAVKNVLPDLVSNTLEVIKLTTLASVVALPELLNTARQAQALTYDATPIVLAALMYLTLLWPIVRLMSRLEHKHLATR